MALNASIQNAKGPMIFSEDFLWVFSLGIFQVEHGRVTPLVTPRKPK
jgi:hypothetical protein